MTTKPKSSPPAKETQQAADLRKVLEARESELEKLRNTNSKMVDFLDELCKRLDEEHRVQVIQTGSGATVSLVRDFPSRIEAYKWAAALAEHL